MVVSSPFLDLQLLQSPAHARREPAPRTAPSPTSQGSERHYLSAMALVEGTSHQLVMAVVAHTTEAGICRRHVRANLVGNNGITERFAGATDGNVISLVSSHGAMLVGMVSDTHISGSLVLATGAAHRFSVPLTVMIRG